MGGTCHRKFLNSLLELINMLEHSVRHIINMQFSVKIQVLLNAFLVLPWNVIKVFHFVHMFT